jgi:hypothetical protein
MIKILYYLVGWCFIFALYGIFVAISSYYYVQILRFHYLYYFERAVEAAIFIWFGHQFLKRSVFDGFGIGKAIIETLKLPKHYFERWFGR